MLMFLTNATGLVCFVALGRCSQAQEETSSHAVSTQPNMFVSEQNDVKLLQWKFPPPKKQQQQAATI